MCLLRGTDWIFKYISDSCYSLKGKCIDTFILCLRTKHHTHSAVASTPKMKARAVFQLLLFCLLQKYFLNKISLSSEGCQFNCRLLHSLLAITRVPHVATDGKIFHSNFPRIIGSADTKFGMNAYQDTGMWAETREKTE